MGTLKFLEIGCKSWKSLQVCFLMNSGSLDSYFVCRAQIRLGHEDAEDIFLHSSLLKWNFSEEIRVMGSTLQTDGISSFLLYILLRVVSLVMVKDLLFPLPLPEELVISNGEMSTQPEGNLL